MSEEIIQSEIAVQESAEAVTEEVIDGFTCEIKTKPLEKWVQETDDKSCHPCLISPLTSYYLGVLKDAGATAQADFLEQAWNEDSPDKPLTIAKAMDKIKQEVGNDLKKKLIVLDCFTQSYRDQN